MVDFEEIAKLAFLNQPLPAYSSQTEQLTYLSMRSLYSDYRKRYIGKEQAEIERDKISLAFENGKFEETRVLDIYKRANEVNVKLAGIGKLVESGDCERCKAIMRILDGRMK